mgnify:CR=1 FL=1
MLAYYLKNSRKQMNQQDQKNLERVLSLDVATFNNWVVTLSDENINYLCELLDSCEEILDEMLLKQSGLEDAKQVLKVAAKQ